MNNDIKTAFSDTLSERYEVFCENPVNHRFSLAYKMKKRAFIKRCGRGQAQPVHYMPVMRIKFVVLAIVLAVAMLMGFSLFHNVDGFSFQKYPEYSKVYIHGADRLRPSVEVAYLIPEEYGYTVSHKVISDEHISMKYTNSEKEFTFAQSVNAGTIQVNTEGYFVEEIQINGNDGFYIQMDDEAYLMWVEDGYVFEIVGEIDKDEAIKLAETTKIKKMIKNILT